MDELPLSVLFGMLFFLILASGFFSGSETSMMAINRYRLRHLAQKKHTGALRVLRLLKRPDRLIGVILLGNNFVNILASSIATLIAIELIENKDIAIPVAAALLTLVILIFSEVTPKTYAALHPEGLAFMASRFIEPLLKLLYPFVWATNICGNALLKLFGVSTHKKNAQSLSAEELRIAVHEAEGMISNHYRKMLIGLLDLEKVTVNDIMVPRQDIIGIDLDDPMNKIIEQISHAQHTRLAVYRSSMDHVVGIVHLRKLLRYMRDEDFNKDILEEISKDIIFVPEGTSLNTQLLNFQKQKRRIALVVDEYGDIQGLVTLEDILEEIIGEFTTNPEEHFNQDVVEQEDGSIIVDASITVRDLNKTLNWQLATDGPKTLNGLILEYLEAIPESGLSLRLDVYPMEIIQVSQNTIKSVRIQAQHRSIQKIHLDESDSQ